MRELLALMRGNGTNEELAKRLGIALRSIGYYRNGRLPRPSTWRCFLMAFPGYEDVIITVMRATMEGAVRRS